MYDKEDEFKMPSKIIIQNSADFQKKNKVKSTSVQSSTESTDTQIMYDCTIFVHCAWLYTLCLIEGG